MKNTLHSTCILHSFQGPPAAPQKDPKTRSVGNSLRSQQLSSFAATHFVRNSPTMKAKWRVYGERGSAKIAYTKLVHQKYLPQSSAKVSGISLQSVLLLAHHSTNCPRIALGSTNVPRLPGFHDVSRIGFCKTLSVHYPSVCL